MTDAGAMVILAAYYAVLAGLCLYGVHRLCLLWSLRRSPATPGAVAEPAPPAGDGPLPTVTVQLPIYNEASVVERLIAAVAALDYPRDRLEIQVLDDSTDGTSARAAAAILRARTRGFAVRHLRRRDRAGYKAGALDRGLRAARGELIAVFDADFVPAPDFLRRLVPHFRDPEVGMVQARWGHLNRCASPLTRIQAILLDAHFLVEHAARAAAGSFFNFNGTAGIWRRRAIETSGGWQHDTLTEDLDLSYRAQLRGWRFVFEPGVVAPAELPGTLSAYRGQQRRWTLGATQTLRKLAAPLMRAPQPWRIRREALAHLAANLGYPLLVALGVLLPAALLAQHHLGLTALALADRAGLLLGTLAVCAALVVGQRRAGRSLLEAVVWQPPLLALGFGMSLHNARAALRGLWTRGGVFERTPKRGSDLPVPGGPAEADGESGSGAPPPGRRERYLGELVLTAYFALSTVLLAAAGLWTGLPFLVLFTVGSAWVAVLGLGERRRRRLPERRMRALPAR